MGSLLEATCKFKLRQVDISQMLISQIDFSQLCRGVTMLWVKKFGFGAIFEDYIIIIEWINE